MRKPLSLLLALLGLFDSLYLLWAYTSPSRSMVCYTGGCDAVRASSYAHIAGVPMPVFGVAGYVAIALLIMAESWVPAERAIDVRYALAGATAFGFLFSVYLEYLQGFVVHAFCTWCITSGGVMTLLCSLAMYNVVHPMPEPDPPARRAQRRSYLVVVIGAILAGVPAFYQLAANGEAPPPPPPPASGKNIARLVRPDSHIAGNPNAALTVVEFGDFECPMCGTEQPIAAKIRAKYGDQMRFVFRQFPLTHIHPFAEKMAEASECAADQGKFWQMADQIYANQSELSTEALQREAASVGLDMGKFNQCLESGADAERVKLDHEDGKALGVNSTPTIFIGKEAIADVPDFDEFSQLIEKHLAMEGASAKPPTTAPGAPSAESTSASAPALGGGESSSSPGGLLGGGGGDAFSKFSSKGPVCSEAEAQQKQPTLINTVELKQILQSSAKPIFVDVRPAKDFATGQIPGAINIPVEKIPDRTSSLPKDRMIIFYESGKSGDICAAGQQAARTLLQQGYDFNLIKVYKDGLAGWQKSGLTATR